MPCSLGADIVSENLHLSSLALYPPRTYMGFIVMCTLPTVHIRLCDLESCTKHSEYICLQHLESSFRHTLPRQWSYYCIAVVLYNSVCEAHIYIIPFSGENRQELKLDNLVSSFEDAKFYSFQIFAIQHRQNDSSMYSMYIAGVP